MEEEKVQELIAYAETLYKSNIPVDEIKKALSRQGADDESAMKIIQTVGERKEKVKMFEGKASIVGGCILLLLDALLTDPGDIIYWILILVGLLGIIGGVAEIVISKREEIKRSKIMNKQTSTTVTSRKGLKSKFGNALMDSLWEEGFRPELKDDLIVFKVEGHTLCFDLEDRDKYFARLHIYNFYKFTDENKALALYNINHLNRNTKYAKLYMEGDRVSVAIDIFPAENLRLTVSRMIGIALETEKEFYDEMNKGFSCN
jgi:hypothetical protein